MNRCIMAASDGGPGSLPAISCARDVAERFGLPLEVVSACEPDSVYGYEAPDLVAGVLQEMEGACVNIRRRALFAQLARAGVSCGPLLTIEVGATAPVVARAAGRRGAALVVVGRGRGSALDRLLAEETALRLMQASRVPVLSVPEPYIGLPTGALAAIDFTSYSIDAARSALALLRPGGELHLVHVWADPGHHGLGTWRHSDLASAVQEETQARLDAVAHELSHAVRGVTISTHLVGGRPVQVLLKLAEVLGVEMIAAGTNGYGFLGRLLMGSVATQLVRRSKYMTLVAPPRGLTPASDQWTPEAKRDRTSVVREAMAAVSSRAS